MSSSASKKSIPRPQGPVLRKLTDLATSTMYIVGKKPTTIRRGRFLIEEVNDFENKKGGNNSNMDRKRTTHRKGWSPSPNPAMGEHLMSPATERKASIVKYAQQGEERKSPLKPKRLAFENMGGNQEKVEYSGGYYVLHTGKRGGRFIIVNNKKVYINKNKI